MSNTHSIASLSVYPQVSINREVLIETIYGLQVDLTLLADWLAREPDPAISPYAVAALAYMKFDLENYHPSLRRH